MPLPACPSRDELAAFSAGNLDEDTLASLGTHIDACPSCQQTMQTVVAEVGDTVVSALRGAAPDNPHAAESACRSALARIAALPEQSAVSNEERTTLLVQAPLTQLREYRLLAKLGEGGMGAVYKALHTRLDKTVAIKVLPADRMRDAASVARFQREMKAVGRLDHPHIVRAMDAGEEHGTHFLVMEYVPGRDLSQVAKAVGPLPVAEACELVRQAALGLQEAHEHGMVHRDIKPSNLILTQPRKKKDPPVVKILDLGLALLGEAFSADQQGLTSTGQMMGTLDYMAPEQGGDSHQVDIRADIYSLGATLYRLLAGEAPFAGANYDTPVKKLMALATQPPPNVRTKRPDVPGALASLLESLLAKDPDERPATPEEVAEALEPFCQGAQLASLLEGGATGAERSVQDQGAKSDAGTAESAYSVTASVASAAPSPALPISPSPSRRNKPPLVALAAAGAGGCLALLLGIVFFIPTANGTIQVEINDPAIKVVLDNNGQAVIQGADKKHEIKVQPGNHGLTITRGDFSFDTTKFELKRRDVVVLKVAYLPGKIQVATGSGEVLDEKPLPAYALRFDGEDDYVELPSLKFDPAEAFTMEAWAEVENPLESPQLLHYSGVPGRRAKIQIGVTLGLDQPNLQSAVTVGPAQPPAENPEYATLRFDENFTVGLHHVALCWSPDGSTSLYWNGRRCPRPVYHDRSKSWPTGVMSMIGANPRTDGSRHQFLKGAVRHARFSKGLRYQQDFQPESDWRPDADTLALYRFEEGAGDVLVDSSGHNRHGKIVGAKWARVEGSQLSPSQTLASDSGRPVLEFNHGLQHVEVDGFPYEPDGPLTLEAWVNLSGLQTAPIIKLRGMPREFVLFRSSPPAANYGFGTHDPTGSQNVLATVPKREGFRHVCGAWDGKTHALYIDGQRVGKFETNNQFPTKPDAQDGYLLIGGENGIPISLDGQIAEVRISKSVRYADNFTPTGGWQTDKDTLALYRCDEGQGDVLKDSSGNNHHGKIVGARWTLVDGVLSAPPPAPLDTLPPAVAPFDAAQAKAHQQAWAKYLGLPVEKEVPLAGGAKMSFVLIPPGEFLMGSTLAEQARFLEEAKTAEENDQFEFKWTVDHISSEGPQHRVRITKPFYLGKYEVTQAQWQAVMGDNPSHFKDRPTHPLESVSWEDFQPFLAKLNAGASAEKMTFALPTQAQWEYACRAGAASYWHSGDSVEELRRYGWFKSNAAGATHAVGALWPNPFGLYDMHGNVWECCADYFAADYYARSPQDDPAGDPKGPRRVACGGGWPEIPAFCRSAMRTSFLPHLKFNDGGFRLALLLDANPREAATDQAQVSSPILMNEPPPLKEWLHGRKILTVAQDGSGQFKTIQTALDALQPGEVVQVLDRGPYRESLRLDHPPEDIGLISERQTVVEIADWRPYLTAGSRFEYQIGLQVLAPRGFRLSGLQIVGATKSDSKPYCAIEVEGGSRVVIEDCRVHYRDRDKSKNPGAFAIRINGLGNDSRTMLAVRDCILDGNLAFIGWPKMVAPPVAVLRNFVEPWSPGQGVVIAGQLRRVFLSHNVVKSGQGSTAFVISPDPAGPALEVIESTHNTVVGPGVNAIHNTAPATGVTIQNNVLPAFLLRLGAEQQRGVVKDWQIGGNWYPIRPESIPESPERVPVFRRPDDPQVEPKFLSENPADRNFARLAPVAGVAPAGALPPGPAPQGGDWFTRLRERWGLGTPPPAALAPPPPAGAPFDATQAAKHQQAWAEHLGTTVETTNSLGMKLRLIPPGEFLMGSAKGDANEQPVHKVTLTRPYFLGTHEVTQQEYEEVIGSNPSKFQGQRLPVEFVTSDEAAEFCRKLSERETKAPGKPVVYRLPTEAEWEFACRAGTTTAWSFGDDPALLEQYAWCKENSQEKTHPVGEKKPNPFGLFDMHGNVFEYCSDFTAAYTADPATDPAGPALGRYRGFRGGSWYFQKFDSRSADRQDKEWPARGTHVGFRVLREIPPAP